MMWYIRTCAQHAIFVHVALSARVMNLKLFKDGFRSIFIHRQTIGSQLYAYCRFMLGGSKQNFVKLAQPSTKNKLNTYND